MPGNIVQFPFFKICPKLKDNKNLNGHVGQAALLIEDLQESEILRYNTDIEPGGHWKPQNCLSRDKVFI